jgi:hypothetical protein
MAGWIAVSTPADAATAIARHPTVGVYCGHTLWSNGSTATFTLMLQSGGTATTTQGDTGTWSQHLTRIKIFLDGVVTYRGHKTAAGINTQAHPGTVSNTFGNTGTWYAKFAPGGC